MTDLDALMTQERDKLLKQREEAQALLAEANAKLQRIEAYLGVTVPTEKKTRAPRQTGKRSELLNLIATSPDGLTRAELIDKLGIRDDKKATMSMSNALSALKKGGQVHQEGRIYKATDAVHRQAEAGSA